MLKPDSRRQVALTWSRCLWSNPLCPLAWPFMPTCWGHLNTLSRMRFQCHSLHGCVENELCRDSTVSSSARLGRIWVSGIHMGRTKGRVPVVLESFSLCYLPLVLHGLICTEMSTTCSRPLATDHREIIAWACSPWDLGPSGPDAHCSHWSTVLYTEVAVAAFSQWESGFISPGNSGLCMLTAGKGFKVFGWEESLPDQSPNWKWILHLQSQWYLQCSVIKCLPNHSSLGLLAQCHVRFPYRKIYMVREVGTSQHKQNYKYLYRDSCMKSNWVGETDVDEQLDKTTGLNLLKY